MDFEIGSGIVGFILIAGVPFVAYQAMSSASNNGLKQDTSRSKYELVGLVIAFFVIANMMGSNLSINTGDILPMPDKSSYTAPVEPLQQFGTGRHGEG